MGRKVIFPALLVIAPVLVLSLVIPISAKSQGGGPPDPAEVARVAACVERHHGVEITLARARQRAAEARAKIEPFVDCQAKQTLLELTEFVVQRER